MEKGKLAALYCRISKNISNCDVSDSIVNQKILFQRVAPQCGFKRTQFFIDIGYSIQGNHVRPSTLKQMEDAIRARIGCVVKGISCLRRGYLEMGYYLELFFPRHNVRFVAINGGY